MYQRIHRIIYFLSLLLAAGSGGAAFAGEPACLYLMEGVSEYASVREPVFRKVRNSEKPAKAEEAAYKACALLFQRTRLMGLDAQGRMVAWVTVGGQPGYPEHPDYSGECGNDNVIWKVKPEHPEAAKALSEVRFLASAGNASVSAGGSARAAAAIEREQAMALLKKTAVQKGVPAALFLPRKEFDPRHEIKGENDPYYNETAAVDISMEFPDFDHDGLPDLVASFLGNQYSLMIIARNTGKNFVVEHIEFQSSREVKKEMLKQGIDWKHGDYADYPFTFDPGTWNYYGNFRLSGSSSDVIAIKAYQWDKATNVWLYERDANSHWHITQGAALSYSGCD
jgi:hypothetical protein